MWLWIKRWRDWAMRDLWPLHRISPQPQALYYSYEKAGLTLQNQPVPWNAEAVLVEASLRLPAAARRKSDFSLRLPGCDPVPADGLRREEADDRHRLFFRLPTPPRDATAEVFWRTHSLGRVDIPVISADQFLSQLRLHMPTVFVRLGERSVAAQTFVSTQCRGMLASAVLRSPTSLAPLLDLGLHVQFRSERTGRIDDVPVPLSSTQLAGREALVTVVPHRFPRRMGAWAVTWMAGDRVLAAQRIRAISQKAFRESLRVSDTRFVVASGKEGLHLSRQVPAPGEAKRIGPCFLVSSREPGMAGLCALQVHAQVPGSAQPPLLMEQTVLVTDGPTAFAPGTVDVAELAQASAFELRAKRTSLGVLSLCPVPTAAFNSEGGFKPPSDFLWSNAAEEELNDRLGRLMDNGRSGGA